MRLGTYRTDTGPATTVGDTEGLVQIQVRDVAPDVAVAGVAHQRVQVGAIDVDLTASLMNSVGDVANTRFIHPVRRGVGHHEGCQIVAVLGNLFLHVINVDVTAVVTRDHHNLHACQHSACCVGAVGARGNQTDRAVGVAAGQVVTANSEQAGVLALAAGVRLQRNRVIAGELSQPLLQVGHQDHVSLGVLQWGEGVQATKFFPGDSFHLRRGVELHGATAQWNHAAIQRVVLIGERLEIAHHGSFRTVSVEDRVVQVPARAHQSLGKRHRARCPQVVTQLKSFSQSLFQRTLQQASVLTNRGFIQGERNSVHIHQVNEQVIRCCLGNNRCGLPREAHLKSVEEFRVHNIVAGLDQGVTKTSGLLSDTLGDCLQAIGAVIDGKHAGHHGEEHLSGADVAGRLVATDVLFSGLQSQAVGGVAIGVFRHTNQATRHLTLEAIAHGQVTSVRATKAQRNTKALRGAHSNVSAELTGRAQHRERQQISGDHGETAVSVRLRDRISGVNDPARSTRVLNKNTKTFRQRGGEVALEQFDSERLSAPRQNGLGLWQRIGVNHEDRAFLTRDTTSQQHGFSNGGGLVQHGGVSGGHASEISDHRLEVQEGFQTPLRNLWLVGRVCRVPTGVLKHVALDHTGRVRAVVAKTNQGPAHRVGVCKLAQFGKRFSFAGCGRNNRSRNLHHPQVPRNCGTHQILEAVIPEHIEHQGLGISIGSDVAGGESAGHLFRLQSVRGKQRHPKARAWRRSAP